MNDNLPPGVTDSMIPGNRPEDARYEAQVDLELGSITLPMFKAAVRLRWGTTLGDDVLKSYFDSWEESGLTLDDFVEAMSLDDLDVRR
jgi:hypothetical protein